MWKEIKNFVIKTQSDYKGDHAIKIIFSFISISQSIAEI